MSNFKETLSTIFKKSKELTIDTITTISSYKKDKDRKEELKQLLILDNTNADIKFNVVGVTFENRQSIFEEVISKEPIESLSKVRLQKDRRNKYDKNAIKVIYDKEYFIGYVPKELNIRVSDFMLMGHYYIRSTVVGGNIQDPYNPITFGMEIRLYRHIKLIKSR